MWIHPPIFQYLSNHMAINAPSINPAKPVPTDPQNPKPSSDPYRKPRSRKFTEVLEGSIKLAKPPTIPLAVVRLTKIHPDISNEAIAEASPETS